MTGTRMRGLLAAAVLALAAAIAFVPAAFGPSAGTMRAFADQEQGSDSAQVDPNADQGEVEGYSFGVGEQLDDAEVAFEDAASFTYTGKEIKPKFTVKVDGTTLKGTTDPNDTSAGYYYFYMDNVTVGKGVAQGAGTGFETATGPHVMMVTFDKESNLHSRVLCFSITKASISNATVKLPTQTYTGRALKPAATVKYKGMTLRAKKDYTLKYSKNVKAGTAKVTVKGTGSLFKGTKKATFKIKKASISNAKFSKVKAQTYTGKAITPSVTVKYKGKTLKKGTDYTVTYSKNVNAGIAKMKVKGKGSMKGSRTIEFVINPRAIAKAKLTVGSVTYTGGFVSPSVKLTYGGKTLKAGTDYTLVFANNIDVGKKAVVYVYARGNYSGSRKANFTIKAKALEKSFCKWYNPLTKQAATNPTYVAGSDPKPTVVTNANRYLRNNVDYTLSWSESIDSAKKTGTGTVTITGKGNYKGEVKLTYSILVV